MSSDQAFLILLQKHMANVWPWTEREKKNFEQRLVDTVWFLRKLHAGQYKVGERVKIEKNTGFFI